MRSYSAKKTIEDLFLDNIKRQGMLKSGDICVAGFSGGADSLCLLFLLNEVKDDLGIKLYAAHIEHGIRGDESLSDMEFCKKMCESIGVPLFIKRVDAVSYSRERKKSLEEAARELRFSAFKEIKDEIREREGNKTIKTALAHHADDNAETMLFQMIRGSAYRGVSGMDSVRGDIIRPLLFITKKDILSYLSERDLSYCIDKTNEDTAYSRNRIRKEVIPILEEINENAVLHMNRSSYFLKELIKEHDKALYELSKECFSEDRKAILRKEIKKQSDFLQLELISLFLRENMPFLRDVSYIHLNSVKNLITGPKGRTAEIAHKKAFYSTRDTLILIDQKEKRKK